MLQAHSWKIDETFYLKKGGSTTPYTVPFCLLDDKLDYLIPNMYIKDPGNNLCAGQQEKKDTLEWKLINNNTQLEIINKGVTVKKDLLRLSSDSLITSDITPQGDTQIYLYLKY